MSHLHVVPQAKTTGPQNLRDHLRAVEVADRAWIDAIRAREYGRAEYLKEEHHMACARLVMFLELTLRNDDKHQGRKGERQMSNAGSRMKTTDKLDTSSDEAIDCAVAGWIARTYQRSNQPIREEMMDLARRIRNGEWRSK